VRRNRTDLPGSSGKSRHVLINPGAADQLVFDVHYGQTEIGKSSEGQSPQSMQTHCVRFMPIARAAP
jgi:hypothetical protein